jgi:Methyltransferase domain
MKGRELDIRPEFSALGMGKPISPLLPVLIRAVLEIRDARNLRPPKLAVDYGCGLLRNLREIRRHFPRLCLVDTELQLTRPHDFGGSLMSVRDYIARHSHRNSIRVLTHEEFEASDISPDVILSINVMDVVPPGTRRAMLGAIRHHLRPTGQFASLVPRNDSHTLELCRTARRCRDGHVVPNRGAFTYYRNWSDDGLRGLYRSFGLQVVHDLSRYRYSCVVCLPSKQVGVRRRVSVSRPVSIR